MQSTLSLLKPGVLRKKIVGKVLSYFEESALEILTIKYVNISQKQAEVFYQEHKNQKFFGELIDYITSGPCIAQVLVGENAIEEHRNIIGATDPKKANPGTVRGDLAEDISDNLVHGSDSESSAKREIGLFFSELELLN